MGTSENPFNEGESEREQALKLVGKEVDGRYKILSLVGMGGMGAVYEAEHALIGKKVALKTLHADFAANKSVIDRFRREAKAASATGHEHIVNVTDLGDLPDGSPYLVMELLEGEDLGKLIEREGALQVGRVAKIAHQICDALAAAHEKEIVHRDLKPDNVYLIKRRDGKDFVKIVDFGISKMREGNQEMGLTRTGMAIGTPAYMSPEQAQGLKEVNHRTDIYAVGVIMYEMLTGELPYMAETYPMLLIKIISGNPDPIENVRNDVPYAFVQLVNKCLSKDANARPQSMLELATALEPFFNIQGTPPKKKTLGTLSTMPPPGSLGQGQGSLYAQQGNKGKDEAKLAGGLPTNFGQPGASLHLRKSQVEAVFKNNLFEDQSRFEPGTLRIMSWVGAIGVAIAMIYGAIAFSGSAKKKSPEVQSGARVEDPINPDPNVGREAQQPRPVAPNVAVNAEEINVQVQVTPQEAKIYIGGLEYPSPFMGKRKKDGTPIVLKIEHPGYETIEQLVVFDQDRSFNFQMSKEPEKPKPRAPQPQLPSQQDGLRDNF